MFSDVVAALPTASPGYLPPDSDVVKLNQNESPYDLTAEEWQSLLAALSAQHLTRYPDPGHTLLEESLARLAGLPREMVMAGNGSSEVLDLLIRATCNPGDEVLTVGPTFHLYGRFCALNRAQLVEVEWAPDLGFPRRDVLRAITSRTKLLLLCRPNNPTGHLYPVDEVLATSREFPGLVAVDEAYYEFAGDTLAPFTRSRTNLAVLRSLSKAYGAAGIRVGYLLAPAETVEAVRRIQVPYGMGCLTQAGALFLLSHPEIMERRRDAMLAGRQELASILMGVPGLTVLPSATNFLLVRTASSADALDRYLRSRRIVVRNLKWGDRHLRISVGTADDHQRLLHALMEFPANPDTR